MNAPEETFSLEAEFLAIVLVAAAVDNAGIGGRKGRKAKFRFVIVLCGHPFPRASGIARGQ